MPDDADKFHFGYSHGITSLMFDEDQHGFNFFWGQTVADALDNVDDVIELHLGDEDIGKPAPPWDGWKNACRAVR